MPADTDIANVALRLIGSSPITSFTDGSPSADVVRDLYDEVRDDLLRSHAWNFATKRVKMAQSSTAPAFGFDYAYPVPSDWLRTISVHDNDNGAGTIVFQNEQVGNQACIVTDCSEVWLRYVARVTDPNLMSVDFRRGLEVSLARDLAVKITSSNTLQDQLSRQADRVLSRARSSDGLGGFPERRPRGSWVTARGGR